MRRLIGQCCGRLPRSIISICSRFRTTAKCLSSESSSSTIICGRARRQRRMRLAVGGKDETRQALTRSPVKISLEVCETFRRRLIVRCGMDVRAPGRCCRCPTEESRSGRSRKRAAYASSCSQRLSVGIHLENEQASVVGIVGAQVDRIGAVARRMMPACDYTNVSASSTTMTMEKCSTPDAYSNGTAFEVQNAQPHLE